MPGMAVVTRYAPSPTGSLHIGGARTALFNWAFARHAGGAFLLRIEDTDRARSTRESEAALLEAFEWLGIDWDPVPGLSGLPRQSERLERYGEAAAELLAAGHAYRCVCTSEEVEAMRERAREAGRRPAYDGTCRERGIGPDESQPFCLRLRIPEGGPTRWDDLIAGPAGEDVSQLDDFVIARTDGSPIYHLAVVVDDHDMAITHVIRGREHLSSTPRQLLLYDAFGWKPPAFAHVPLLVQPGGKKLSKREAAVSVQSYRDRGFPPQSVLNFIARLGWGHGDLEVFTTGDLARLFALEDVGRSPSQVHEDKLVWLSQHYLQALGMPELLPQLAPFLERVAGHPVEVDPPLERLLELLRVRSKTLAEMAELARFYLVDRVELEGKAVRKHLAPGVLAPLEDLTRALAAIAAGDWSEAGIEAAFQGVLEQHELELGKLAQPVRVAITGGPVSPGIFETLVVLGRERSLARLERALDHVREKAPVAEDRP